MEKIVNAGAQYDMIRPLLPQIEAKLKGSLGLQASERGAIVGLGGNSAAMAMTAALLEGASIRFGGVARMVTMLVAGGSTAEDELVTFDLHSWRHGDVRPMRDANLVAEGQNPRVALLDAMGFGIVPDVLAAVAAELSVEPEGIEVVRFKLEGNASTKDLGAGVRELLLSLPSWVWAPNTTVVFNPAGFGPLSMVMEAALYAALHFHPLLLRQQAMGRDVPPVFRELINLQRIVERGKELAVIWQADETERVVGVAAHDLSALGMQAISKGRQITIYLPGGYVVKIEAANAEIENIGHTLQF